MNVLILAAGYATRLYPLTLNKAKPLLEIAGKPMVAWVLDNLNGIPNIETIYIVTNDKFATDFQKWADSYHDRHPEFKFKVLNDGSKSDDDKLGAIGDINFVINREELTKTPLLIVAGDNLFAESLSGFIDAAKNSDATVGVYDVGDKETIKKYGNIDADAEGIITHFEEKPQKPRGTLAAVALYYYSPKVVSLFKTYLAAGNNPDQPGRFIQWLYARQPVNAYQIRGKWLDIGSKETLEEANRMFSGRGD